MATVFDEIPAERWVTSNALAFAVRDAFPVTRGHTIVITRRAVRDWFDATREEQLGVLELVELVKQLDAELCPAGYNVGLRGPQPARR